MNRIFNRKRMLRIAALTIVIALAFENVCFAGEGIAMQSASPATETLAGPEYAGESNAESVVSDTVNDIVDTDASQGSDEDTDAADGFAEDSSEVTAEEPTGDTAAEDESSEEADDSEPADGEVLDDSGDPAETESVETDEEAAEEVEEEEIEEATASEIIYTYEDEEDHCQVVIEYSAEQFGLEKAPEVKIVKVTAELPDIISAVEEANEGLCADKVYAYDISFTDEDGSEVEPVDDNTVKITFKNTGLVKGEDEDAVIRAYHVDDDMNVDELAFTTEGEDLTLEASSFSIFAIMNTEEASAVPVGTGRGLTKVYLRDFMSTGHIKDEVTEDIAILDADDPTATPSEWIEWEPVTTQVYFPLEISADFFKNNLTDDRDIVIELAPGLRFNYTDPETEIAKGDEAIDSVIWDVTTDDHGYDTETAHINKYIMDTFKTENGKPYQPRGGRVTIKLKHTHEENHFTHTLRLLLVADKALINYEQCRDGYDLTEAIKVSVSQGDGTLENTEAVQNVRFKADHNDYSYSDRFEKSYYGGIMTNGSTHYVKKGQTVNLIENLCPRNFALTEGVKTDGFVMKKLSLTVRTDSEALEFSARKGYEKTGPEKRTIEDKDWWYYTFTTENFGNATTSYNYKNISLQCVIPSDAAAVYKVEAVETEQQWWNEDESITYSYETDLKVSAGNRICKLDASGDINVFLSRYYGINSTRGAYFQRGITGRSYQTQINGFNIAKSGGEAVNVPLIYTVELPADKMFVNAVGIPFSIGTVNAAETAQEKEEAILRYYPGRIELTDEEGNKYVIEKEDSESAEEYKERIDALAVVQSGSKKSSDYGFIVSTETLADAIGYPEGTGLQTVKVWLPDMAVTAERGAFCGAYSNNYYAVCGVYGYPREETDEGDNYTTEYTVESAAETKQFQTISRSQTFTVHYYGKDGDQYSGSGSMYGARPNITVTDAQGKESTTFCVGDDVRFAVKSWTSNSWASDEDKTWKPLMWIPVPEGMTLNTEDAVFTCSAEGSDKTVTPIFTDVTAKAKNLKDGWSLYELTFRDEEVPYVGGMDSKWYQHVLNGSFSMHVQPAVKSLEYDIKQLIFCGSELRDAAASTNSTGSYTHEYKEGVYSGPGYGYGLSNSKVIASVTNAKSFTIGSNPDIAVESAFKKSSETEYRKYDSTTDGISLKNGEALDIRVRLENLTGSDADELVVYMPVPKTDMESVMGTMFSKFFTSCGFDMYLKGNEYDEANADALFEIRYATVTKASEIKESGIVEPENGWNTTITDDVNFIRIALKSGKVFSSSAGAQYIPFNFSVTDDTAKVDTKNKWRSSYMFKLEDGTSAASFINRTDNFGCVLQIGTVNGTVYLDKNRNGIKDADEEGIKGVKVTAVDSSDNKYSAQTGTDGAYQIDGLPGGAVTVSVENPGSPEVTSGLPRRFTAVTPSTGTVCGSDVTPNTAGTAADKAIDDLKAAGGTVSVNAGFTEPLTHSVKISGSSTATVKPTAIKSWPEQTIEDATALLSTKLPKVTLGTGEIHTGWKIGAKKYTDSELLAASFTADQTIYAMVSKSLEITVATASSITYSGNAVTAKRSTEGTADIVYTYEGNGKADCTYYLDSKGKTKTSRNNSGAAGNGKAPVWAGTYYVRVHVAETEGYTEGYSSYTEFTIGKAELTATYGGETITYRETPELKVDVTGFVNGETAATAAGYIAPTVSAGGKTDVGSYPLTPSGGAADNYSFRYNPGELNIVAKKLTKPTAKQKSFTYDGKEKKFEAYGFDSETMDQSGTEKATEAKSYKVTYALKDAKNYTWSDGTTKDVEISWKINKAKISAMSFTVTAPKKNGTPAKTVSAGATTYEGKNVAWEPEDAKFKGGKAYTVNFTAALKDTANYEYANTVAVTVNKEKVSFDKTVETVSYTFPKTEDRALASISVKTKPDKIKYAYGDAADLTGLVLDLKYDDDTAETIAYSGHESEITVSPTVPTVATTSLTITYGGKSTTQGITVNKAQLTAAYGGETITYGDSPALAVTVTGFVNGETAATAAGYTAPTVSAAGCTAVGKYTLTPAGGAADNYSFKYDHGDLKIVAKKLTKPTASVKEFTYDGKEKVLAVTGFDSTTMQQVKTDKAVPAGSYTAEYALDDKNNYTWADGKTDNVVISWKINKAQLTAAYGGETITYGGSPKLTVKVTGFVNGETAATAAGYTAPTVSAAGCTAVGKYPLTPAGGAADNYSFKYTPGELKIVAKKLTKPIATLSEFTYDGNEKELAVIGFDSTTMKQVGTDKATKADSYTAVYALNDPANYAWADGSVDNVEIAWTINKVQLTAVYEGETITYGDTPALSVKVTGFVNGETAATAAGYTAPTVSAAGKTAAGQHTLTPAGGAADNYSFTYTSGTLNVNKAELTAAYAGETITSGKTPALRVDVTGFVNGETAATAAGYTAPTVSAEGCTAVGKYTLTPAGGTADNYYFTYVSGELQITSGGGGGGGGTGSGSGSAAVTSAGWVQYSRPVANPTVSTGKWKLVPPTTNVWTFEGTQKQKPVNTWLYLSNPNSKDGRTKGFYYFDENGYMVTGWSKQKSGWYYLNEDKNLGDEGMMCTGWHQDKKDGHTYYLDKELGNMLVGKQLIDGKEYNFNTVPSNPNMWTFAESKQNAAAASWVYTNPKSGTPYGALIQ